MEKDESDDEMVGRSIRRLALFVASIGRSHKIHSGAATHAIYHYARNQGETLLATKSIARIVVIQY